MLAFRSLSSYKTLFFELEALADLSVPSCKNTSQRQRQRNSVRLVVTMPKLLELLILVVVPENPAFKESDDSRLAAVDRTICCISFLAVCEFYGL
jgi:hypothetical protein